MISPVLRYPGGKSRVRKKIIQYAPSHYAEYREPFVGGGSMFFAVSSEKKRWINDIHSGLIAVYMSLRDRPEEFIKMCKDIPPHQPGEKEVATKERGKKYNERLGKIFDKVKLNEDCDQAFRYFFVNRTVWMGRVNYDILSRLYYSVPEGWNIVKTNKLELAAEHLKGTNISCGNYLSLLEEPGEDVWIYCDPPYVVNTDMVKTDKQYQHNFTIEDHEKFANAVKKCDHKVCISYDDHEIIRDLYSGFFAGFNTYEEEWKYSGSSLSKKKNGKELIITNYAAFKG